MIKRSEANPDDYQHFLLDELFLELRAPPGFLGADLLRRSDSTEVEFIVLTRFRSLEDVRAFAGDDVEAVVIPPGAELLAHHDERTAHYEACSFARTPS